MLVCLGRRRGVQTPPSPTLKIRTYDPVQFVSDPMTRLKTISIAASQGNELCISKTRNFSACNPSIAAPCALSACMMNRLRRCRFAFIRSQNVVPIAWVHRLYCHVFSGEMAGILSDPMNSSMPLNARIRFRPQQRRYFRVSSQYLKMRKTDGLRMTVGGLSSYPFHLPKPRGSSFADRLSLLSSLDSFAGFLLDGVVGVLSESPASRERCVDGRCVDTECRSRLDGVSSDRALYSQVPVPISDRAQTIKTTGFFVSS